MRQRSLAIILLVICATICIYFLGRIAIHGYWIWGGSEIDFAKTGQVGDFIGGVVGTIISGAGFYYLYLTLNAQRNAFTSQQRAFERERLESKFFELIKMHRENVSELSLKSIKIIEPAPNEFAFEVENVSGKAVFKAILEQFVSCRQDFQHLIKNEDAIFKKEYKEHLLSNPAIQRSNVELSLVARIDICFSIVFYGLSSDGVQALRKIFEVKYKENFIDNILKFISLKPANDEVILQKWMKVNKKNSRRKKILLMRSIYDWRDKVQDSEFIRQLDEGAQDTINQYHNRYVKYYGGHQFRLGHYFRHLYQAVKFINNQVALSYEEKYEYIKTLRAQLSTYEQAILFLNSLSSMGHSWELSPEVKEELSSWGRVNFELITKYNLIKNLPGESLYGITFRGFYPKVEFEGDNRRRNNSVYR